jgi:O-antigen/teichoic acid export membrane protein
MYRLASEQLQVTIQLSAPILLLLTTFAGEITRLLFSPEFAESARLIPLMAVLVITSVAIWPVHTLQSALGLPKQQAAGSLANTVVTLTAIAAMHSDLGPMSFASAMALGGLAQLALQSGLLRARAAIAYRAADWGPMALLAAAIAGIAVLGGEAPDAAKVAGTVMAGAWAYVALKHYRRHRS